MPDKEDDGHREGFWASLEGRAAEDPGFRLKLLKWFWLIALAMMLAGYGLMIAILLGRSPFG